MKIDIGSLLKGLDVAGDLGGLEKLREMFFPAKKTTPETKENADMKGRPPGQEDIIEGTILEVTADYVLTPPKDREGFLQSNKDAHKRVTRDFYRRNPRLQDVYEKFLTQLPLWALSDGLGARTKQAPPMAAQQPQQSKQKGGGQSTRTATPTANTLDSEHIRLVMVFKVCLGMQALEADNEAASKGRRNPKAAGDRVIIEAIERMRSASPFEKGRKALEKGGTAAANFLNDFLNEL